jgi:hypothetical protein
MSNTTYWDKIAALPTALSTLLEGTEFFSNVLRGFPENVNAYNGDIATVYMKGLDYNKEKATFGQHGRPQFQNSVIGIISRGTKTSVHDKIITASLTILKNFDISVDSEGNMIGDEDWLTVSGNARNTVITDFNIYPEKTGKSLLTTAVINLEHDMRWRL